MTTVYVLIESKKPTPFSIKQQTMSKLESSSGVTDTSVSSKN